MTSVMSTSPYAIHDAPPTMASPSWWGADSLRHRLVAAGEGSHAPLFVKTTEDHARAYVDVPSAVAAAFAAGTAGIGPEVYEADERAGTLVMADLTDTHRTACLTDFADDASVGRLASARRAVHQLKPGRVRTASVFDDIRALALRARDANAVLPGDLPWMLRFADAAESAITASGIDREFCHGDGNVSNVMVANDSGDVLLLDWDVAAVMDPLQDVGAVLAELRTSDLDAREVFEMFWGTWDGSLFDRARVYGIADAIRWGLVGTYAEALRPGVHEYSKFSDWQFFKVRMWLRERHVDDRLRNI